MKRVYRVPIQGTVIKRSPLTGDEKDPIVIFPIHKLPDRPTFYDNDLEANAHYPYGYECLEYNIDEGWCEIELEAEQPLHDWLTNLLPQLSDIQKNEGRKLIIKKGA